MDIKNLILIGGGLLMAAIVVHGLWIAWRARRDPLRLKIDNKLITRHSDRDPLDAEFPNGGARVVTRWGEPTGFADEPEADLIPRRAPAVAGERDRAEPVLGNDTPLEDAGTVEPVEPVEPTPTERAESLAEAALRDAIADQTVTAGLQAPEPGRPSSPTVDSSADSSGRAAGAELRTEIRISESPVGRGESRRAGVARRAQDAFKAFGSRQGNRPSAGTRTAASASGTAAGDRVPEGMPEDLIIINVLAPREQPFTGTKLVDALRANALRYGDMNIFHRLDAGTGVPQYSVANIIEPGTFDMADVEEIRSPGICFFMRLPGPEQPLEAFEDLQRVAHDVAQRLGGELKDERRSVLTGQTVEHYRHRVAEFCRRRMSVRA